MLTLNDMIVINKELNNESCTGYMHICFRMLIIKSIIFGIEPNRIYSGSCACYSV